MRPRFANRGSRGVFGRFDLERPASMRPRFANRGSTDRGHVQNARSAASMRPRFANRGSAPSPSSGSGRACGFNEAPIRESGKSIKSRDYMRAESLLQ